MRNATVGSSAAGGASNFGGRDLLATTGDYLRLWSVSDDGSGEGTLVHKREALLNNVSLLILGHYVDCWIPFSLH